ncbi:MAG: tyrosine-type recombinase/integrase [Clostridia bacterium]|nr:tyrosine-type recombinase/integrase [Clostridia bacterium]
MIVKKIKEKHIDAFLHNLREEERSEATVGKYLRDVRRFREYIGQKSIDKGTVLSYKEYLCQKYAISSANSMLSSLNSFFSFLGWHELRVRCVKVQRQLFIGSERELTRAEYKRLLDKARGRKDPRLYLLIQTICSSGIRVSELRYITVEALKTEKAEISCKGKLRCVFLTTELCKMLLKYAETQKIKSGPVFISKNGIPLDRSNIWCEMKRLGKEAGVDGRKVFPHNLRHLFARTYYTVEKDIVRLADILGHSSINTTRIYTTESGEIHRRQLGRLGLVEEL